jgi:hypothetical protein
MLRPAPTYLKRSECDGSGRQAECHQQCSGRRRSHIPEDIFRLPNARRLRFCGRKAAPYRRWLVGSDGRRQRSRGSCGATPPPVVAVWVSRVDSSMARRAISPSTKAGKACAERGLAGLCSGSAGVGWLRLRAVFLFLARPYLGKGDDMDRGRIAGGRVPGVLSRSLDACRSTSRMTSHAHQPPPDTFFRDLSGNVSIAYKASMGGLLRNTTRRSSA